jgi:hypothetical protein
MNILFHPDCRPIVQKWLSNQSMLDGLYNTWDLERMPHVDVHVFPRSIVSQEWWEQWYCEGIEKEPVPTDYYAFRAWGDYPNRRVVLLEDESEIAESLWWLLFHELSHIALAHAPYLRWGFAFQKQSMGREDVDERWDDEMHESDPEEMLCNQIATAFMGRQFDRKWWRSRIKELELENATV